MIAAAAEAAPHIDITAVTILTSLSEEDLFSVGFANPALESAVALAQLATSAGARAIDRPEQHTHHDERGADDHRRAKGGFGQIVEEHTADAGGNRGHDQIHESTVMHGVTRRNSDTQ